MAKNTTETSIKVMESNTTPATPTDTYPEKVSLKNFIELNIRAAITDASTFNHFILKEYAPKCQGTLSSSKNPAKHTVENCIYDELCGWLDAPTVTGISILNIKISNAALPNALIKEEPKIDFREIVDLLYDMCKLAVSAKESGDYLAVNASRLNSIKDKCKYLLSNIDSVEIDGLQPQKSSDQVGVGVRKRRVSRRLPTAS